MENGYALNITGLDDKMDSGIPDKHIVLLTGTPGTMKSTLAYYILYNHAKNHDVKSLYLTLEQEKDGFLFHLNKLGLGDPNPNIRLFDMSTTREQWMKLSQNKITQVKEVLPDANCGSCEYKGCLDYATAVVTSGEATNLCVPGGEEVHEKVASIMGVDTSSPEVKEKASKNKDLETFKRQLQTLKNVIDFKLLVIDSLPVIEMMFRMQSPRDDLFHFFKWLKKLGVTTFLISEMSQDSQSYSRHDIDFLADGIIKLSLYQQNPTTVQRHIQIAKMRGVDHTTDPFVIRYTGSEFEAMKVLM